MACRLEEIPRAARLRRVRDPRPVGHRACAPTTWACARSRTPAATAASRSSRAAGTCESGFTCPFHGWCYGLDGTNTARPAAADVRRAQPGARRHRPHAGAVRGVGRVRVDQPRRRRAAAAAVHRAGRHDPRRVEGGVAAHRVVVRVPPPGELEARRTRRSSSSTTWCETHPQLVIPGAATRRATARRSTRSAFVDAEHPLPAHDERRHGRDGATPTTCASPRACATSSCPPTRRWRWRPGTARSTTRSCSWHRDAGPRHPRPQRARRRRASTSRWATASRTTSCCRCTAARPRTASARSGRRRR